MKIIRKELKPEEMEKAAGGSETVQAVPVKGIYKLVVRIISWFS